jgi:hypothetical protein
MEAEPRPQTTIRKRGPIIVATLFSVILVQLNVGCNDFWVCFTGFPVRWVLWSDASTVVPFTIETAVNFGITLFAVVLLFGMVLPRDWRVWTQHLVVVVVAACFSWLNPWRQTYVPDTVEYPLGIRYAEAGFPYIFRYVTQLESLPFLLLNLLIGVLSTAGLFVVFEAWIKAHSVPLLAVPSGTFKKWGLVVILLFLFVHANGAVHGTGLPFVYDFPETTRPWAAILYVLFGISLVVVPLRFGFSHRRGNVMAFVTFYFLANLEDWRPLKRFLGSTSGRGFPFTYTSWRGTPEYYAGFLLVDIVIGLLLTLLIYRISSADKETRRPISARSVL